MEFHEKPHIDRFENCLGGVIAFFSIKRKVFVSGANLCKKNSTRRSVIHNTHISGATFIDVITNLKKGLLQDLHILLEYIHAKPRFSMPNDGAQKCHDVMTCHAS